MRSILPAIVCVFSVSWIAGCHLVSGVTPCRHQEHCPDGEVCDTHMGVCGAPLDGTPDPTSHIPDPRTSPPAGEGEGEGSASAGEGEGSFGGEGEGEGEGAGVVSGEGEGEGEGAVALAATVCGDHRVDLGEQCDDGNRVSGDGCSSTCRLDTSIAEVEANDYPEDPSPLFVTASASTVMSGSIALVTDAAGTFSEADGFWLHMPTAGVVRIETFTKGGADDCQGSDRLLIQLYTGNVTSQTIGPATFLREGEQNGIGGCAVLEENLAAGDYWAVNLELTAAAAVASYRTQVSLLSSRGDEQEPNDDVAHAELAAKDGLDAVVGGALGAAGDVDVFAVEVPPGRGVRAEVVPGVSQLDCDAFNARVALLDASGTEVGGRASIYGSCAYVDGTGSTPRDVAAQNTTSTTKTMYVAVAKGSSGFTGVLPYKLALTVR